MAIRNAAASSSESNCADSPQQFQWLQTTLSDLDMKMKEMLTFVEDDDSHSTAKAEIFYEKRPELIHMLEEFFGSYRSLAEKYDQLRSELSHVLNSGHFSPSDSKKLQCTTDTKERAVGSPVDAKLDGFDSLPESVVDDPVAENDITNFDCASPNRESDNLMSIQPCNMGSNAKLVFRDNEIASFDLNRDSIGDFLMGSFQGQDTWSELKFQVMKLMEENLQQQAELIKRNDEKRDAIKELRFQLDQLKGDNKALQSSLGSSIIDVKQNHALQSSLRSSIIDVKQNHSQKSTLKGLLLGKFFRGGSA